MTCMEFMTLINDYIHNQIYDEKVLEDFIEHQYNCTECREDLELYYTLQKGLEDEEVMLDFNADLNRKIRSQEKHIATNSGVRKLAVTASVLGGIAVFLAFLIMIAKVII